MTPEQESRQDIDRQLVQAGWIVQDYRDMNISAGPGVAVCEFPLATGSDTIKNSRKSSRTIRRRAAARKETVSLRNEVP
jgi:hypothetical protein